MSIGHTIRRYTSDKPRASRRYRRSGQSSRRVCLGSVSCNRGFSYADAMRIVRPELAAKLAEDAATASRQTPENAVCGDRDSGAAQGEFWPCTSARGILGGAA